MYEMRVDVFSGAHLLMSNCLLDPGCIVAFIESLLEELLSFMRVGSELPCNND
jgi:hypothetical protein